MGNFEARLVHDFVPVHEQIEVDRPRPPAGSVANAPELTLDAEERVQELARGQARLESHCAVQELGLVDVPDRSSLAQCGDLEDLHARLGREKVHRSQQRHLARAEVGPMPT